MRLRRINFAKTATESDLLCARDYIISHGGCIVHEWPSTNWRVLYEGEGWG